MFLNNFPSINNRTLVSLNTSKANNSFNCPSHVENQSSVDPLPPFPEEGEKTLFIGEGNFSFSLAWLEKHMGLLKSQGRFEEAENLPLTLIATEVKPRSEYDKDPFALGNIDKLEQLGSLVLFEVDGRTIDTHPSLRNYNITRIQANCLDNGHFFCDEDRELPNLILDTAYAASRVLRTGGVFELILLTPKKDWQLWQGPHYEIARVEEAGFFLNKGTPSFTGQLEYPGYVHNKTYRAENGEVVQAATLDEMTKFPFVRHPTQRTPSRYKGTTWAHKQAPTGERDPITGRQILAPTQSRYYRYYTAKPDKPGSPTIFSPHFFDLNLAEEESLNQTSIPLKTNGDEDNHILEREELMDEFDSSMALDDSSGLNSHQKRTSLRGRCTQLVKKIKRRG